MSDDFDWNDPDNVVFGTTRGVAVYFNPAGNVVIRQEGGALDDGDTAIVVPADRLHSLIAALQTLAAQVP